MNSFYYSSPSATKLELELTPAKDFTQTARKSAPEFVPEFELEPISDEDFTRAARKSAPVKYPTNKPGQTSQTRRRFPPLKKSEQFPIHSSQGKGAQHKKQQKRMNPNHGFRCI